MPSAKEIHSERWKRFFRGPHFIKDDKGRQLKSAAIEIISHLYFCQLLINDLDVQRTLISQITVSIKGVL